MAVSGYYIHLITPENITEKEMSDGSWAHHVILSPKDCTIIIPINIYCTKTSFFVHYTAQNTRNHRLKQLQNKNHPPPPNNLHHCNPHKPNCPTEARSADGGRGLPRRNSAQKVLYPPHPKITLCATHSHTRQPPSKKQSILTSPTP